MNKNKHKINFTVSIHFLRNCLCRTKEGRGPASRQLCAATAGTEAGQLANKSSFEYIEGAANSHYIMSVTEVCGIRSPSGSLQTRTQCLYRRGKSQQSVSSKNKMRVIKVALRGGRRRREGHPKVFSRLEKESSRSRRPGRPPVGVPRSWRISPPLAFRGTVTPPGISLSSAGWWRGGAASLCWRITQGTGIP